MLSVEELQKRYARVAIEVGVRLRPGQALYIWKAPVEASVFVRLLAEEAYRQGSQQIEVFWSDDELRRLSLFRSSGEICTHHTKEFVGRMVAGVKSGAAFLFFDCTCSGMFEGLDVRTFTGELECEGHQLERIWTYFTRGTVNWTVLAVPVKSWAARVYPEIFSDEAPKCWSGSSGGNRALTG